MIFCLTISVCYFPIIFQYQQLHTISRRSGTVILDHYRLTLNLRESSLISQMDERGKEILNVDEYVEDMNLNRKYFWLNDIIALDYVNNSKFCWLSGIRFEYLRYKIFIMFLYSFLLHLSFLEISCEALTVVFNVCISLPQKLHDIELDITDNVSSTRVKITGEYWSNIWIFLLSGVWQRWSLASVTA